MNDERRISATSAVPLAMLALRYRGPGELLLEEIPTPAISDGEIMVEVRACGVCATDVKTFQRGHPRIAPGTVLGHEIAGIVVQTAGIDGWRVGDRVVVAPYVSCGVCRPCLRGRFTVCERLFDETPDPGGFAGYVRIPHRLVEEGLIRIPDGTSFTAAAFSEPLGCCLHSLESLGLEPGESLLVIGDGPMGLLHADLGRHLGASPVLLSGITPQRLTLARSIADVVIDVRREGLKEAVHRILPHGADKVVVTVGQPGLVGEALALAAAGGAVNLFAGLQARQPTTLDLARLHYDEVRLLGTFGLAPGHLGEALDLIASGAIRVERLLTGTVGLDRVTEALDDAAAHRGIKTVVVRWEDRDRAEGL